VSLGRTITEARKRANLSQRELAPRVTKEDGRPISPQYLNDFERDRRTPTSDRLIEQLAQELGISAYVLYHRAGGVPRLTTKRSSRPGPRFAGRCGESEGKAQLVPAKALMSHPRVAYAPRSLSFSSPARLLRGSRATCLAWG
jgi:hypothetical protein